MLLLNLPGYVKLYSIKIRILMKLTYTLLIFAFPLNIFDIFEGAFTYQNNHLTDIEYQAKAIYRNENPAKIG